MSSQKPTGTEFPLLAAVPLFAEFPLLVELPLLVTFPLLVASPAMRRHVSWLISKRCSKRSVQNCETPGAARATDGAGPDMLADPSMAATTRAANVRDKQVLLGWPSIWSSGREYTRVTKMCQYASHKLNVSSSVHGCAMEDADPFAHTERTASPYVNSTSRGILTLVATGFVRWAHTPPGASGAGLLVCGPRAPALADVNVPAPVTLPVLTRVFCARSHAKVHQVSGIGRARPRCGDRRG